MHVARLEACELRDDGTARLVFAYGEGEVFIGVVVPREDIETLASEVGGGVDGLRVAAAVAAIEGAAVVAQDGVAALRDAVERMKEGE